jgi:quercetin dioxygenase-like cupin family protein
MVGTELEVHPVHLGAGSTAVVEPPFGGTPDWYEAYAARHAADGAQGRLVSMHSFDAPWTVWEMHPSGAEVVLCTSGSITLLQERADGTVVSVVLKPGQYAINEAGVWHTADVERRATAVFITAGRGTEHRPR